jgi:hypothetical protein
LSHEIFNPYSACVERVFDEFFQRGGGAFHHLACSDAVDQLFVQRAYRAAFRARAHRQEFTLHLQEGVLREVFGIVQADARRL